MKKDKYVIIGNSIAAIGAIERIREYDKEGSILVISQENYHVYSRPMIPGFVYGKYKEERLLFRERNFYKKNNVRVILGKKVVKIDASKKEVFAEDEERFSFEKLLIATGGKPFVPPIKGHDEDCLTFTTLDDAKKIIDISKDAKDFVVIGAGLIGLKLAESLAKIGKNVKVVELADRVLSAITDQKASDIFLKLFMKNKVDIMLKCTVSEILREEGRIKGVLLSNGERLRCDSVAVAIGVVPNTDIAKESGINVNRGIVVNDRMETSIKEVYAAGDVAEAFDIINNENRNIPLWPNASLQGKIAGSNMAGHDEKYPGSYMMNSISFFDLPVISYGLVNTEGDNFEILEKNNGNAYKKIIIKNNRIVGAIFVDDIDRAGIINGLIRDKVDVSGFKEHLVNGSIGLVYLPKKLRDERLKTVPRVEL